ncbi:MAG: hypothetical protein R2791_08580 [Saprospiraceae bacterium]
MGDDKKGVLGTIAAIVAIGASVTGILVGLKQIGWIGTPQPEKQEMAARPADRGDSDLSEMEGRLNKIEGKERQQREEALLNRIADLESKQKEHAEVTPVRQTDYDLSGDWYATANPGTVYRIVQYGEELTLQEISFVYGVSTVTAAGSGAISGNSLTVNYYTMFNTTGVATFNIGSSGNLLNGQFRDNVTGANMAMQLQRQ